MATDDTSGSARHDEHADAGGEESLRDKAPAAVLVGFSFLLLLFVLFVCFSGYSSRVALDEALRGIDVDGGGVDAAVFRGERIEVLEQALPDHSAAVAAARTTLSATTADVRLAKSKLSIAWEQLNEQIYRLVRGVNGPAGVIEPASLAAINAVHADATLSDDPLAKVDRLNETLAALRFLPEVPTEQRNDVEHGINEARLGIRAANEDILIREAELAAAEDAAMAAALALEDAELQRNAVRKQLEQLRGEHSLDVRGLIQSYRSDWLLGGTLFSLLRLPTVILTLLVTIAAGGLGAVVGFSRRHQTGRFARTSGRLLLNLAQGIAAAIAIFFFMGTGLLMLTNGGPDSGGLRDMSPYAVAFVAFLSGFMAEDAFKRIQQAGRDFFGSREPEGDAQSNPFTAS